MKRFSRVFTLLVLLALLAVPMATTFAQDGQNPLCTGLAAEDCNLMTAPTTAMVDVTSFTVPNWSVSFTITIPEDTGAMMEGDDTSDPAAEPATTTVSFSAQGSTGGFSMDPNAEILLHLVIDDAMVDDGEQVQSGSAEIVVTQEMAFIKYNDQWYGDTLENAGINPDDLGQLEDLSGGLDLEAAGIDLTGAVTTTRGEDVEMMGQQVATFSTDVNVPQLLVALLSSPAAGELLGEGMGGEPMSPEDVQMMGMFLQPMLAGTTLTAEQWVGLDDNYLHHLAVDMTLALDLSMLLPEVGAINGELHFATDIANFNEPLSAPIPEDYAPMEQLEADSGLDLGDMSDLGM